MRGLVVLVFALLATSAQADEPVTPPPPVDDFGPVLLIEAIEITGNTDTHEEIIRRALTIAPGDVLHATDRRLRIARFKVLALGFFREVTFAMKKGSVRGNVIIEIAVIERGTFVLNKLWFGRTSVAPAWLGFDVGDRNLFGFGISAGVGFVYAMPGDIDGARDQWAGEFRLADGSLGGSRWGAHGSVTLVHGSESYRVSGDDDDASTMHFRAFPYRRFGGRFGATYDVTALSRLSGQFRVEAVETELPIGATRTLEDGREVGVDLYLEPGGSRIVTAGIGFDRDTRSDPILPHAGGRVTATVEIGSSTLGGDYDFATMFARYEYWWPMRDERHALGMRLAGGLMIGNAPRFDRIHLADVNFMVTPRALGLVLSNATPIDFLPTRDESPTYGELGGVASIEYAIRLFRGTGRKRVYGGDLFFGTGLWTLAESTDLQFRDASLLRSLPIDLYIDAGVRIDTDLGIFELTIANALGRLR